MNKTTEKLNNTQNQEQKVPAGLRDVADTAAVIAQAVQKVEDSRTEVPGLQEAIRPKEKQRILKARPDTERRAQEMVVVARNFPRYASAEIVDELDANLAYIAQLRTYQAALANALKVVDDTMFLRLSEAWKSALDLYSVLSRQKAVEPELNPGLANMTASLALGPRKAAQARANGQKGATTGTNNPQPVSNGNGSSTTATPASAPETSQGTVSINPTPATPAPASSADSSTH